MVNIFLQIGASPDYRRNLERTIFSPLTDKDLEVLFENPEVKQKISSLSNEIYAWAVSRRNPITQYIYEKMEVGDYVIFRTHRNIFFVVMQVIYKINPNLYSLEYCQKIAMQLWKSPDWVYIYLLKKIKTIDYPQDTFFEEIIGRFISFTQSKNFVSLKEMGVDVEKVLTKLGIITKSIVKKSKTTPLVTSSDSDFIKLLKRIYNLEIDLAIKELKRGKNILFYGPPGSGKTTIAKIVSDLYLQRIGGNDTKGDSYILYTVHSGTDYFDLVARIVPTINENGDLIYKRERRYLLDALMSGKVLILDEINRTQIDTALGIFFTYLEKEHRVNDAKIIKDMLNKELNVEIFEDELRQKLERFRVIGTLNVYDRTFLFKLGDALKRRFTFIEITTTDEFFDNLLSDDTERQRILEIFKYNGPENTARKLLEIFGKLNKIKPLGLSVVKDTLIFSTYFKEKSPIEAIDAAISVQVVPFFENDLNFSKIRKIFVQYNLEESIRKLESLNIGVGEFNE